MKWRVDDHVWTSASVGVDRFPVQIYLLILVSSNAVRAKLISSGVLGDDAYVVVAGPANAYSHYIATPEEYSVQRYEGASTIYGPRARSLIFCIAFTLMRRF